MIACIFLYLPAFEGCLSGDFLSSSSNRVYPIDCSSRRLKLERRVFDGYADRVVKRKFWCFWPEKNESEIAMKFLHTKGRPNTCLIMVSNACHTLIFAQTHQKFAKVRKNHANLFFQQFHTFFSPYAQSATFHPYNFACFQDFISFPEHCVIFAFDPRLVSHAPHR